MYRVKGVFIGHPNQRFRLKKIFFSSRICEKGCFPSLGTSVVYMGGYPHRYFNTLRPRQNGRHFADDILRCIFLNENAWISLKISLKFVPKVRINNIPTLVQIMAWRRSGDKPLSEPMMFNLLTHICVTRPQWVKFRDEPSSATVLFELKYGTSPLNSSNTLPIILCWLICYILTWVIEKSLQKI